MTLLYGILFGIALAFIFGYGPSFFAMMQSSAQHGFKATLPFVYGIIFSDVVMVALMLGILASIVGLDTLAHFLQSPVVLVVGSVVLVVIAIVTMSSKVRKHKYVDGAAECESIGTPGWKSMFGKGFVLNFFNPLTWFFWLSIVIVMAPVFDDAPVGHVYVFFTGVMGAELGCNMLKCFLAALLQRFQSPALVNVFSKIVGIVLIGFAAYILFAMVIFKDRQPERETTNPANVISGVLPPQFGPDTNLRSDSLSTDTSWALKRHLF